MDEAMRFYSNVLRVNREAVQFVCEALDDATSEIVAHAIECGQRIILVTDQSGLLVALCDWRTGQSAALGSVNARDGRERIYQLRHAGELPKNG
ncbi:hypothetical protein AB4Y42_01610 [Paraburkholderia sp. EG286B]|uniref:hypothetical protein n=1 Tax=Paraburkholderia sp. EG286B TaxID=3237011 RepID=UPI0034D3662B